jgi:hypothetical protein
MLFQWHEPIMSTPKTPAPAAAGRPTTRSASRSSTPPTSTSPLRLWQDDRVGPGQGDRLLEGLHLQVLRFQAGDRRGHLHQCLDKVHRRTVAGIRRRGPRRESCERCFERHNQKSTNCFSGDRCSTTSPRIRRPKNGRRRSPISPTSTPTLARSSSLGRESGEFERKTPLDETCSAITLADAAVHQSADAAAQSRSVARGPNEVINLVLRSLAP